MSGRVYGWLLRLYPRAFRHAWGADLMREYRDRSAEARHAGMFGVLRLWALLSKDLLRSVPAEHVHAWRGRAQMQRTSGRRGMSGSYMQDVRYGARTFLRAPAFTFACLATLGLGIGATTTIFSIVDGVLLRPLPYRDAGRLVQLGLQIGPIQVGAVSGPDFFDLRERTRSFSALAATRSAWLDLAGSGEPERFESAGVTASYFDVVGVTPALGRAFRAEEDRPGGELVVLLSDGLWRRRFGGDVSLVGRTLTLNGAPRTVVGVMPPDFQSPEAIYLSGVEVWLPLGQLGEDLEARGNAFLQVIGRLRPGVALESARADVEASGQSIVRDYPGDDRAFWLASLLSRTVGDIGGRLYVLLGAVGFLLLIACANVANLFLVRSTERGREMAMRAALGAGRARLASQLLTESMLMGLAGGALGVLVAWGGLRAFKALSPGDVPRLAEVTLDTRVLLFALSASLLTGILFGLVPALQGARRGLTSALRDGGHGSTSGGRRHRLRGVLVVLQTAIALVLLTGAGLLINSFVRLSRVPPGFDSRNAVYQNVVLPPSYDTPERRTAFFDAVLERVRALPGVDAAGGIHGMPLDRNRSIMSVLPEGLDVPAEQAPRVPWHSATPDYFRALGVALRAGRDFDGADRADAPAVAIASETFAARFWPGEDPVGRTVRIGANETLTVVGVAADVRHYGLAAELEPMLYLPLAQAARGNVTIVARHASADPAALIREMRAAVWAQDATIPLSRSGTLQQQVSASLVQPRFYTALLAGFSVVALALAFVGLYGTLAYTVRTRRREVGIRVALGAGVGVVRGMVVAQGMRLAGAGIALGFAGSLLASRALRTLVFGVTTTDLPTFAIVAAAMAAVALVACWFPARRAARTDPMIALRSD